MRQLVRSVRLEIGWAEGLWRKFPLLARALGEVRGLRGVEICIVGGGGGGAGGGERGRVREEEERDGKRYQPPAGNVATTTAKAPLRTQPINKAAAAIARTKKREEDPVLADVILKAEKKMLKDLVMGLKHLRYFRLTGFRDEAFARALEEYVRVGNG